VREFLRDGVITPQHYGSASPEGPWLTLAELGLEAAPAAAPMRALPPPNRVGLEPQGSRLNPVLIALIALIVVLLMTAAVGVALYFKGTFPAGTTAAPALAASPGSIAPAPPRASADAQNLAASAQAKENQGDYDGAIAIWNQLIASSPDNATTAEYYFSRGKEKEWLGNSDDALADLNRAIALSGGKSYMYDSRGDAKLDKGDVNGAIADYNQAIAIDSTDAEAYCSLGVAQQITGNTQGAATSYQSALSRGKDAPDDARLLLWMVETEGNIRDEANQELQAALNATWTDVGSQNIAKYLLGQINDSLLMFGGCPSDDRETLRYYQCEASYFIGMTRLLKGDRVGATTYLYQSAGTRDRTSYEYPLAKAQLAALGSTSP